MALVTVEEVLKLALPAGTRIAGGHAGLGREVSWASILRAYPSGLRQIEEGTLALVAPSFLEELGEPSFLWQVLQGLSEVGAPAAALVGDVPPGASALADSLAMPLLSLPRTAILHEAERSVISLILNRRAELEKRGVQIYRQLAQLVTAGKGIGAIIETLQQITSKTVVLQDEGFRVRLYACPPRLSLSRDEVQGALADDEAIRRWLETFVLVSTAPPITRRPLAEAGHFRFVAPIIVRDRIAGYVSVLGKEEELTELDWVATGRAASVCAMEMAKEWAIVEAENRLRGHFLDDLLRGNFTGDEEMLRRAKLLGYDVERQHAVLLFQLDGKDSQTVSQQKPAAGEVPTDLGVLIASEIHHHQPQPLWRADDGGATVLLPLAAEATVVAVKRSAEILRQRLVARLGGRTVSVGIGHLYLSPQEWPKAYREAQHALSIGQRLLGGNRTTFFGDLRVHRLLAPLHSTPVLAQFSQENLGPLLDYDQKHGSQLVRTLTAFLAHHGNLSRTAKSLFLHRNTLAYRIHRIQQITGLNLEDSEDRLCLQLALKIREMV